LNANALCQYYVTIVSGNSYSLVCTRCIVASLGHRY